MYTAFHQYFGSDVTESQRTAAYLRAVRVSVVSRSRDQLNAKGADVNVTTKLLVKCLIGIQHRSTNV